VLESELLLLASEPVSATVPSSGWCCGLPSDRPCYQPVYVQTALSVCANKI